MSLEPGTPRKQLETEWERREAARKAAAHLLLKHADRARGDVLWYILDDIMAGRVSNLTDAEVVKNALEKNRPGLNREPVELIKLLFQLMPGEQRAALLPWLIRVGEPR